MPHFPKPFFRPKKSRWYVQLDGKQVNLGPEEEEAFRRYHEIMADREKAPKPKPADGPLVVSILDLFLEWCQKHKARGTYDWYLKHLQSFTRSISVDMTIAELKPFHVQEWVDSHPKWKGMKRGAIIAVQRAMNWATKIGRISGNPIRSLEKPPPGVREQLISADEFQEILAHVKDAEFRDLLDVAWETGARPHELFIVEARHVDLANSRWIFAMKESKGKRFQRVVYLTDKALEITERLTVQHAEGPLFRNSDGEPWTAYAVNCRFCRLRLAIGKKRMKQKGIHVPKIPRLPAKQRQDPTALAQQKERLRERRKQINRLAEAQAEKVALYSFRHSWCTDALESGELDAVTVSVLLGHRDTQMISRVYGHLLQRTDHLRQAVRKARGA